MNLIEEFEKIQGKDFKASSAPEFEFYDNEKGEWIWDIQPWKEKYEKASDTIISEVKQEINVLNKIQNLDLKLLREMTINAKQAHNDLAEKFQVTPVKISRRMTFLNENVNDYVLLYDVYLSSCPLGQSKVHGALRGHHVERRDSILTLSGYITYPPTPFTVRLGKAFGSLLSRMLYAALTSALMR